MLHDREELRTLWLDITTIVQSASSATLAHSKLHFLLTLEGAIGAQQHNLSLRARLQ
jgi:hypothetical protein